MTRIPAFAYDRKEGYLTDINGKKIRFEIVDHIVLPQSDYPRKMLVLEKIRFRNGKEEIRIGYYIVGKKGRMKNRWTWGQFCPFLPSQDLEELIRQAHEKNII